MVMTGFLNAKCDENWKMTVIYGIGVAGAVALMKALFAMFGGAAGSAVTGFYIVLLRSRRPPRFDLDLFASWINGRSFQPARIQPRHPFVPTR
jgi:hypothetical protein